MMADQLSPTGRFKTILVASDGSEFSDGAIREAIGMAAKCGARLYASRVVRTNEEYEALAPQLVATDEDAARTHVEDICARAAQQGVECEPLVRRGNTAYEEIVGAAEAHNADLIVIGRRGRGGWMRLMMGGVTRRVIGLAHCPVFVVPRAATVTEKPLLVATDGSRYGDIAATVAASLAKRCDQPLSVVCVAADDLSLAESESVAQRTTALLLQEGVEADSLVLEGRPAERITETAEARQVGVIIVGSHGRTGLERLMLGSVSERVIGLAESAVLVAKS